jgi:hypothetical protein
LTTEQFSLGIKLTRREHSVLATKTDRLLELMDALSINKLYSFTMPKQTFQVFLLEKEIGLRSLRTFLRLPRTSKDALCLTICLR